MNLGFVPVRCGSKSIPLKNIKDFCGKPLVYWSLLALEEASCIDKVYVATDCSEIKQIVIDFKFTKVEVYNRSEKNSRDTSSTESVLLEFIESINYDEKDNIFLVQATSPLTTAREIDEAHKKMKESACDSLLTAVKIKRFLWDLSGEPINYNYRNRPRRQDFNGLYMENGAFYINSIKNILKHRNRLSGNICIFEMPEYTSLELDEIEDWEIAEFYMKKRLNRIIQPRNIKLFITDVDGTLTDSGMYYGNNGEEFKKFNTKDGKGFELLRERNIKTGFFTSEQTSIVSRRGEKLKVDFIEQGVSGKGKLKALERICKDNDISFNEVAYIGDDINCKDVLESVGYSGCPNDASKIIKSTAKYLCSQKGGEGAVREFIEYLLPL